MAARHYYQGQLGKRLWTRLRRTGLLLDDGFEWEDDAFVAAGNGLTDLVKRPTAKASELTKKELEDGRPILRGKVRAWQPRVVLFAYRPPAEHLLGGVVEPGRCGDLEGALTFLLTGPYAARADALANEAELSRLLAGARPAEPAVPAASATRDHPEPQRPTQTAVVRGAPTQQSHGR